MPPPILTADFAGEFPELAEPWQAATPPDPKLLVLNEKLAAELGLEPEWLRIGGYWYPRGGMPIDVFFQTGPAPEGVWIPDQGVAPYRGRG